MVDVTELDDLSGEKSLNNLHEDISGKYPKPEYVGTATKKAMEAEDEKEVQRQKGAQAFLDLALHQIH